MNSHAIVNSILANGYSINMNGGVYRRGKAKSFEMIAFTASKYFELERMHSHTKMLMIASESVDTLFEVYKLGNIYLIWNIVEN